MQQRRRDGDRVETEIGQDVRRGERMVDERLSALARLAPMGGVGHRISVGDKLLDTFRAVGGDLFEERGYGYVRHLYRTGISLCARGIHA